MGQILVRDLDKRIVERLKKHARENGRSLQSEAKKILEASANKMTLAEFRTTAARIRKSLEGRKHTDSVLLLREDRDR